MDPGIAEDAALRAKEAAQRHELTVVELHSLAGQRAAADLLRGVWDAASTDQVVNASTLRALSHSGNYVAGAYREGRLVGVGVAFFGAGHLHSHITGVDRSGQGGGVGYALKQHQRAWALARGVDTVCWTFDPLVRRNAYFNLRKLGASATEYLPDFYGPMDDGINTGDTTDRLYIRWDLAAPRAVAAARGGLTGSDAAARREAGAAVLLDRDGDEPAPGTGDGASTVLVAMPADIEALRGGDLAAALRWRHAVRSALGTALAHGYVIRDATRDGYYVLEAA